MAAFWENITEHKFKRSQAGSSQPYPIYGDPRVEYSEGEDPYTWTDAFHGHHGEDLPKGKALPIAPEPLDAFWAPMKPNPFSSKKYEYNAN